MGTPPRAGRHTPDVTKAPTEMCLIGEAACERDLIEGGIGHNLPQEDPRVFAQAVVEVDSYVWAASI
ncbi:MAG: hypothetical protein JWM91_598 [Rhodospirillales bacterium]|nr:hypothetical protein [Rhodospirillales bacterium]